MEMNEKDKAMYFLIQELSMKLMEKEEELKKEKYEHERYLNKILDEKDEKIKFLDEKANHLQKECAKLMSICSERFNKIKELEKEIKEKDYRINFLENDILLLTKKSK